MTKRFERIKRTGVRITARDLEIVRAVFEARYMTVRQIARLLFRPTTFSSCKERLRRLYDLRYLEKRQTYINEPDIYYLGFRGKRAIVAQGEYSKEHVDRTAGVSGGSAKAPVLMMAHELTLSRIYVNARLECALYGWTLQWRNTRTLELLRLGVEPDAWLRVSHGNRSLEAYLEFTAVMPTQAELRKKIEGYVTLWSSQPEATPVLWFTTSRSKVNLLLRAVAESEYGDYFLVGLVEDAGQFLSGRIWCWGESEGMIQWIKPPS